jgi:hypothetical protein
LLDGVVVMWELCVLLVALVWPNESVPIPLAVHYLLPLAQLSSYGGDNTTRSQCDWAACKLFTSMPHWFDLIHCPLSPRTLWCGCVDTLELCTPDLKNRYYAWSITTQWCIGKILCLSLRVTF